MHEILAVFPTQTLLWGREVHFTKESKIFQTDAIFEPTKAYILWENYLTQTTIQSWISRILMQKNSFFRFSSNCPRCYLMMLKRFLGNLRHSKQSPKLLNTSWDHLKTKKFSSNFWPWEAIFCLWSWPTLWKLQFMRVFKS